MTLRKTYHVIPKNEGWRVVKEGAQHGRVFGRKTDAIKKAWESVRDATRGEIIVHGKNGSIQKVHTYGVIERVRATFMKTVSDKEIKSLPRDAARQHDKYIYGKSSGRR